ncbi:hypothetical protein Hypma_008256 [Hypsizygus marmoreus]|uniref:DUF7770 domain-containing protein n=1 Tax=Hypsizygus marmoreus TaxID=39966 RepID=A0A369JRZ6_HYPMA|nr:hypothetical protein Hypma_008256 [Hypsizygus marmoreus]
MFDRHFAHHTFSSHLTLMSNSDTNRNPRLWRHCHWVSDRPVYPDTLQYPVGRVLVEVGLQSKPGDGEPNHWKIVFALAWNLSVAFDLHPPTPLDYVGELFLVQRPYIRSFSAIVTTNVSLCGHFTVADALKVIRDKELLWYRLSEERKGGRAWVEKVIRALVDAKYATYPDQLSQNLTRVWNAESREEEEPLKELD